MTRRFRGLQARWQRGQSLVEVCVACITLMPRAIVLVSIAQYIHIKRSVQQAAHEMAWRAVAGISGLFPRLDQFEPGKTAPDVVPYDKLQPYQQ